MMYMMYSTFFDPQETYVDVSQVDVHAVVAEADSFRGGGGNTCSTGPSSGGTRLTAVSERGGQWGRGMGGWVGASVLSTGFCFRCRKGGGCLLCGVLLCCYYDQRESTEVGRSCLLQTDVAALCHEARLPL